MNGLRSILISLVISGSLPGCMFYYKVQKADKLTFQEISRFDSLNKYLILHHKDTAWHLSVTECNETVLAGKILALSRDHMKYKTTNPDKANRYIHGDKNIKSRKEPELAVLDEVHLYVNDTILPVLSENDQIRIPLSEIIKAEIYQEAKGRTTLSWVIPIAGGLIITGGAIAIIWILVSQSMFDGIYLF